jgi:hypothetical protein
MKRVPAFCFALVGVLVGALTACEQLTGVADLRVGEKTPAFESEPEPDPSDPSDGGTNPVDATVSPSDATADTSKPIDTGIDTTPAACTTLPTNETFPMAPGAVWTLLGSSVAANPGLRLTPSTGGLAGTLWWSNAATFDRFDVSFAYAITTDPASTTYGPGDGMAFAWVSSAAVPALGATGGSMGIFGLTGFAVAIDAYTNTEFADQATPNIAIKNTVDMTSLASTAVNAALIDGNAHTVRVRLVSGSVTVYLDGATVLGPTALPGYTPYSGFWGFGAGTGGAFEDHKVVSVTARIGTTGPCAADPP